MKIAAVQHDIAWEQASVNLGRYHDLVAGAAGTGARLVVLTEMFSSGFSMNTDVVAEEPDGPSATFLHQAATTHGVWTCASIPMRHPEFDHGDSTRPHSTRPYNTLCLVSPNGEVHHYRKIHPFTYSTEPEHYDAGATFLTVDVEGLRVTTFICYDLRFADEFWACAAGTDCFVIPANWPATRRAHWQTLLRARAIENQAYVVGVNRVGSGGGLDYAGDSAIIDPLGEVIASAASTEALLVADVDPAMVASVRAQFPFQADRRT